LQEEQELGAKDKKLKKEKKKKKMNSLFALIFLIGLALSQGCEVEPSSIGFPSRLTVPLGMWAMYQGPVATYIVFFFFFFYIKISQQKIFRSYFSHFFSSFSEDNTCAFARFDYVEGVGDDGGKRALSIDFCVTGGCPDINCTSGFIANAEISQVVRHSGVVVTPVGVKKGETATFGLFAEGTSPDLTGATIDVTVTYGPCGTPIPNNPATCDSFTPKRFLYGLYPTVVAAANGAAAAWTNAYQFSLSGALTCPTYELTLKGTAATTVDLCATWSSCPSDATCTGDALTTVSLDPTTPYKTVSLGNPAGLYGGYGYVAARASSTAANQNVEVVLRDRACAPPAPPDPSAGPVPSGSVTPPPGVSNTPVPSGSAKPSSSEQPHKREGGKSHKKAIVVGFSVVLVLAAVAAAGAFFIMRKKTDQAINMNQAGGYAPMLDPSFD
jgi:hypothetical protein